MSNNTYLSPDPLAGRNFYLDFLDKGKVVFLNMLRFRDIADYSSHPSLAPDKEISGEEAYQLYAQQSQPYRDEAGTKTLFYGKGKDFLIGPEDESWHAVILVQYDSVESFLELAKNKEYQKILGHRTAALKDSRLMPLSAKTINLEKEVV